MLRNTVRSLLAEPRPARPPRRVWRDWVLVALVVISVVVEIGVREDVGWTPFTVVFTAVLVSALLWRRTQPLAALGSVFVVSLPASVAALLGGGAPPELFSMAWVLVLVYALFRWGSGREAAVGMAIMLASVLLDVASDYSTWRSTGAVEAVIGIAILLFPAELGATIRYRTNSRAREIDQVKLREREQLARELHDTVAHHVSAIAIQAQAGRAVAATRPDRALEALEIIEEAASRTLAEMRTMVGILRDGAEPDLAPQPGVTDIADLAHAAGDRPRIDVAIAGDLDDLPPSVDAAVYRLAQESITNAVRHARHATRVDVRVTGDDDCVRLTVCDDGDPRPADPSSWGYGLIGMTERVGLLGGTFEAGPSGDSGWMVRAVLPRTGATQ